MGPEWELDKHAERPSRWQAIVLIVTESNVYRAGELRLKCRTKNCIRRVEETSPQTLFSCLNMARITFDRPSGSLLSLGSEAMVPGTSSGPRKSAAQDPSQRWLYKPHMRDKAHY